MLLWAHEPLYLVIARWGEMLGRWINRNDVVQAFNMSERRISFQLSYISRKEDRVVCRTRSCGDEDILQLRNDMPVLAGQSRVPQRRYTWVKSTWPSSRCVECGMKGDVGLWDWLLKVVRGGPNEE
ncbi:CaiF/GrlA family transcriptional regulator [Salmonella enterica]|nr:CaiF/GrlA family transcriptional regulator [Salmonella enterica]EBA9765232.1 CaiF/GrlA family transcriptional regulator [Salmonella enterica]